MNPKISDLLSDRNNNFNLIRFMAASAVVYGHCFTVIQGEGQPWIIPIIETGDFGFVAVNIFFILSGFLITKSWFDNPNLNRFIVARVLRIFPALFAASVFTAFIIGPLFSSRSFLDYFADLRTWAYVPFTGTMIEDRLVLPGLFASNFEQHLINAPLWTLKYEFLSYVLIGVLGGLALLRDRNRALVVIGSLGVIYLVFQFLTDWREQFVLGDNLMRLWACFFTGSLFYIVRERIALGAKTAMLLALLAITLGGTNAFELASTVALAYGLMWFALVPSGAIRKFNRFGDYSYGLYIFAWPIQQATVQLIPDLDPHTVFTIVFPTVLLMAIVSWHFLEKPCLDGRRRISRKIHAFTDKFVAGFNFPRSRDIGAEGKVG